MSAKITLALYRGCTIWACCCLCSCTIEYPVHKYKITPNDVPTLTREPRQKIPFRVGFFMDSGELDYIAEAEWLGLFSGSKGPLIDVEVRALFDRAARRMFKEVVPIAATEVVWDPRAKNLDVVVVVGAIKCGVAVRDWPPTQALLFTTITAEWTIQDPDGKPITSMISTGQGQARFARDKAQREVLIEALDAHFAKVYDNIVMTAWWRDSSWKSN